MRLSDVKPKETVILKSISANETLRLRAENMGLSPGSQVCVISVCGGDLIVLSSGVKIAMGRRFAECITVLPSART